MVNSTTITLQWGPVACLYRNGEITGYLVTYGEVGSDEAEWPIERVSGDTSGGMTTITGLSNKSVYNIKVAADTSAGTGVFSRTLIFGTFNSEFKI